MILLPAYILVVSLCLVPYLYIRVIRNCTVQQFRVRLLENRVVKILNPDEIIEYTSISGGSNNAAGCMLHIVMPIFFLAFMLPFTLQNTPFLDKIIVPVICSMFFFLYLYYATIFLNYYYARIIVTSQRIFVYSVLTGNDIIIILQGDVFSFAFTRFGYICTSITINGKKRRMFYQIKNKGELNSATAAIEKRTVNA